MTSAPHDSADFTELEHVFADHNYSPLDVVIARGEGAWVEDVEGRRYFDALAGYSALNFGHSNPRLIEVAERQLRTLTPVSYTHLDVYKRQAFETVRWTLERYVEDRSAGNFGIHAASIGRRPRESRS